MPALKSEDGRSMLLLAFALSLATAQSPYEGSQDKAKKAPVGLQRMQGAQMSGGEGLEFSVEGLGLQRV